MERRIAVDMVEEGKDGREQEREKCWHSLKSQNAKDRIGRYDSSL